MPDGPNRDLLSGSIVRTLRMLALPTLVYAALQSASGPPNALWAPDRKWRARTTTGISTGATW